ncbi:MAG: hypothetical protein IJK09_01950 [Prevotella sp.]|nr:hypothetical protein [Prevotella sp.]MBR0523700.1 hypothetical protein [Prevotella sp.]
MNKRYIFSLCLMLLSAISMTSCLKDNDSSDVTYYDDAAITAFTLTTVNTYTTTTSSDGTTKTTKATLSTKPVFVIDHNNLQIYNPVGLPETCDLKHVVVSISTKNSGQVGIKSLKSDSLYVYSSTDSIDFTQPRELKVFSQSGAFNRTYTVTFNTKQSTSASVTWTSVDAGSSEIPEELYHDVAIEKTDNGFMLSKDNLKTWSSELLGDGEDASLLPTRQLGYVSMPYTASINTDYELIAGVISENDAFCSVWRKISDYNDNAPVAKWVYIPVTDNQYRLPNMGGVNLVKFNDQTYAIGADGRIYKTRDWGLTWKAASDDFDLPITGSLNLRAATDKYGNLWIINLSDEKIWKGVITKK